MSDTLADIRKIMDKDVWDRDAIEFCVAATAESTLMTAQVAAEKYAQLRAAVGRLEKVVAAARRLADTHEITDSVWVDDFPAYRVKDEQSDYRRDVALDMLLEALSGVTEAAALAADGERGAAREEKSQEIAKAILNEMALIEEAESDGNDRWNTLKGYLEAATENSLTTHVVDSTTPCPHCGRSDGGHYPSLHPSPSH
jgi:hypothetical protein